MKHLRLRGRLQNKRCEENENIDTHFDTMHTLHEDLAMLGDNLNDEDSSSILLGSLPQSYDSHLSAITATLSVFKLGPDALKLSMTKVFQGG